MSRKGPNLEGIIKPEKPMRMPIPSPSETEPMPDAVSLAKIARACAVSTDYLLGLTDEATPDMDERA
ncbi:MAG: hypothetical protein IKC02_06390, partial [Oscillospiraceae bacterium]|nr:hypothetical protein [Oscillospiraceae bacterium]